MGSGQRKGHSQTSPLQDNYIQRHDPHSKRGPKSKEKMRSLKRTNEERNQPFMHIKFYKWA